MNLPILKKPTITIQIRLLAACSLWLAAVYSTAQDFDTVCNWDGIVQDWEVSTPGSAVVANPSPDTVNGSAHCFKFITASGSYDYMYYDMEEAANFIINPRYRIKVLAPPSGGNIALKFENPNNTFWQEIVMTPVPGEWTDLEFDFTGLVFNDFFRMVIFPDFEGTTPGIAWYLDDILRETGDDPGPLQLESNLPIIVINTFGVPIPDEPKITAHMGIIDNGPGVPNSLDDPFTNYDGNIGIEMRGQSSQYFFPKKSFSVETRDNTGENLDVPLLGMPPENDWVLYAPYTDKSMLRNVVSFEIFRKMDNYATRSVFCEVVINGEYKGVYTLMEKIKKDDNRVDIAALNPDDILGDELTGGYIIKVDKVDWDFEYGTDGWKSNPVPAYPNAMDIIFQYYYPEPDEIADEQRAYIKEFITNAENTLCMYYFSNPYIGYQQYFDVLSFIDFMLLSEISKEVDKYRYSTYFHKKKDSDGGKLYAGPAWDFDLGYGNVDYWDPGVNYTGWLYQMVEPVEWGIMFWWKRMMEDPYFKDMAKTRWTWLRQNKLADNDIHAMIDSILLHIDEAKDRNYERWPILGQYVWPNYDWAGNDFEDEVDYFEHFLFNRLNWMDNSFFGDILHPAAGISAGQNTLNVVLYNDYFDETDLENDHFTLNHAPAGVEIEGVIYNSASDCQLLLSSDLSGYPEVTVTISEKAVNYWLDITSSPLSAQGTGDGYVKDPSVSIFESNRQLHILCDGPASLPDHAEIINLAGQHIMTFGLEKKNENIIPVHLDPGIYLFIINTVYGPEAMKFAVLRRY
jgi:hypothetical protein